MAAESGIASIGINPVMLAGQAINFLIVYWVLKKFVFSTVLKKLDERKNIVETSLKKAEAIELREKEIQVLHEQTVARAQKEATQILEMAHDGAEKLKHQMLEEAKLASEKMVHHAQEVVTLEKQKLISDAKKELTALSLQLASKILSIDVKPEDESKYIASMLEKVS